MSAQYNDSFVINEHTQELIHDLLCRSGQPGKAEYIYVFLEKCNTNITFLLHSAIKELESLIHEKHDKDLFRDVLHLFRLYGYPESYWPLMLQALNQDWHENHEDIVSDFQWIRYSPAVNVLCDVISKRYDYLDYDDSSSLAVKCVYALGALHPTPFIIDKLTEVAASDEREYVREAAQTNLDWIKNHQTIRSNEFESAHILLELPQSYGCMPDKEEFLRQYNIRHEDIFFHTMNLWKKSFEEDDDFTCNDMRKDSANEDFTSFYMRQESLLLARTFGTNKEYLDTVFHERKALSPAINDYNVALFKKEKYVPALPVLYKSILLNDPTGHWLIKMFPVLYKPILHPFVSPTEKYFISACIRNIDAMVSISPADAAKKLSVILQKTKCQEIRAAVHYFMKVNMIY